MNRIFSCTDQNGNLLGNFSKLELAKSAWKLWPLKTQGKGQEIAFIDFASSKEDSGASYLVILDGKLIGHIIDLPVWNYIQHI